MTLCSTSRGLSIVAEVEGAEGEPGLEAQWLVKLGRDPDVVARSLGDGDGLESVPERTKIGPVPEAEAAEGSEGPGRPLERHVDGQLGRVGRESEARPTPE